jgi:hypothetical protein
LSRAVGHALAQNYDPDPAGLHGAGAEGSRLGPIGPRPKVFTYRVYPGEGLWPNGRPARVTVSAAVVQLIRAAFGQSGRRALLFRASGSSPTKVSAIGAYESQSRLLGGELRYVWRAGVELYWPADTPDSRSDQGPIGSSA